MAARCPPRGARPAALPDADQLLTGGITASVLAGEGGLLWSAWPLFRERLLPGGLPPDSQRGPGQDGLGRRPPKRPPPTTRDSPWGVASFVSLIPGFGALAWVLPALEAETQSEAATYYLLAAVYSAPVLRSGLDLQDPFLWAMYVACVVHVQVERAAKGYDL